MSSSRAVLSSSYTIIRETHEMTSPMPPTLGYPEVSRRRMRAMKTCGYFLMLSCGFLFVPGSILLGLGAHDTGTGEDLIKRPGIVLLSIAVAGVAVGTLLCCCVRKYKEKYMAETILMKRHSVYSVTSMRSHRSSAVSNQSSQLDQRSEQRSDRSDPKSPPRSRRSSRPSRSPSYSRQSSLDSRQSPPPRPRHSRSPSASYSRKSSMESRHSPTRSRRSSSCSYTRGLSVHAGGKSSRRSSATSVRSSSRSPRTSLVTFLQEGDVTSHLLAPPRRKSKHKSLPSIEVANFSTSDLTQGSSSRRQSKDSCSLGKHTRSMSLSTSLIDQRRGSHGPQKCTKEIYLTVPSQHRRFSR